MLTTDLRDIVLGLTSAAIAAIIAKIVSVVRTRRQRARAVRNHPIGGRYASSYTDEINGVTRVIRDEVHIAQRGLEFTGVSRNLETGRGFALEGRIVDERYISGTYGGEHRADGASGVFFMALDLLQVGRVQGLWAGFGAESGLIISGKWDWRRLDDSAVRDALPDDPLLPHAASLLTDALGPGYITSDDLRQLAAADDGMVLLAKGSHDQVLGVGTAAVMPEADKQELATKLESVDVRRTSLMREKVGLIKSAAVVPPARGKGIGLHLVQERLARLKALGCAKAVVLAWDSGSAQSSIGVLEAAGFRKIAELPEYWREPNGQETFDCIRCGVPCVCAAIVMTRSLYDYEPPTHDDTGRRPGWRRGDRP